jgi:hypothetical protein
MNTKKVIETYQKVLKVATNTPLLQPVPPKSRLSIKEGRYPMGFIYGKANLL